MHLKNGAVLKRGEYRIEKLLGQGGFGITYLAVQSGLDRKVAIKEFFMKDLCERDADTSSVTLGTSGSRQTVIRFKEKFIREAKTIASLRHPNIVNIYDVFEENGTAYYVMEYHDGGSLSSLDLPLSVDEASGYIRQIASALSYLHKRNTMHLDVKPSNILLDESGNAVLIDFGVSKHYDSEDGSQTSSTPVGLSRGYAPLEQNKSGGVSQFTPSTDIYSLGATFYKLITGQTPPEADEVNENGLPAFPSSVPSEIASVIAKAMQPKRKDRPQSIKEFLAILDSAMKTIVPTQKDEPIDPDPVVIQPDILEAEPVVDPSGDKTTLENNAVHDADKPARPASEPSSRTPQPSPKKKSRKWLWWLVAVLMVVGLCFILFRNKPSGESVVVSGPTDLHHGYGYVDLGLSVMWATHNLGASEVWDSGNLYAWGEVAEKDTYTSKNSRTYGHDYGSRSHSEGSMSPVWDYSGNREFDAATANWEGGWRMPTEDELQELIDNCTWIWTALNGSRGYMVTSKKNGNSIFLPAADIVEQDAEEKRVGYWSASDVGDSNVEFAEFLHISPDVYSVEWENRYVGLNVRPVYSFGSLPACEDDDFHRDLENYYNLMRQGSKYEQDKSRQKAALKSYQSAAMIENEWKSHEDSFLFDLDAMDALRRVERQVYWGASEGAHNGHEWVDLGLSVKWATCNVGASSPGAYGKYYAWGETTTKSTYTDDNCASWGKSWGDIGGNSSRDAATANWGGDWRMPTREEYQELLDNCTWEWTTQNDHNGYKVTSKKNDQSIFLPAAGWRVGADEDFVGSYGLYWSSMPLESDANRAYPLYLSGDDYVVVGRDRRSLGFSVRPVLE